MHYFGEEFDHGATAKVRRHRRISYVKSVIRIKGSLLFIAGALGWTGARYMWIAGALCFIVAEIGGILEEVYGA